MMLFGKKLTSNYGVELALFHKIREYSDGVSFWNAKINWDRYLSDHTPRFEFHLAMLNYTIIEFNVYYLYHREELDSHKFF